MKRTFTGMVKLVKSYLPQELLGFFLTAVYTSAVFAAPIVSKYLIDEVLPSHSATKLYYGLACFFFICMLQPVAGYLKDAIFLKITENITYTLRATLFAKIIQAPLRFFDVTPKGKIIARVLNDGRSSSEFISHLLVDVFKNILLIALILGGMFYLSVLITSMAVLILAFFVIVNAGLSRKFDALSAQTQKNFDRITTNLSQMLDGILTIKAFGIADQVNRNFETSLHHAWVCNQKIGSLSILLNNLTNIVTIVAICIIYGLGMSLVMAGQLTLGTVMALEIYFQMLIQPLYELQDSHIEYQKLLPIFGRLFEYLDMAGEETAGESNVPLSGAIVAENVSFSYSSDVETLANLNLVIPSPGLISFVGRSGSGKSTFIKLLLGFYHPTSGKISIGGKNILDIGVGALRNHISFVPQEVDLFNCSIKENITCGARNVPDERILSICKKLNLHAKISALPEGYDSVLNERANLSGGEKQRLGIARALLKSAPVFIFDEPTSALDPENEEVVRKLLEELARERTVIVVAHKISTIINSDKIVLFENGAILTDDVAIAWLEQKSLFA